MSYYAYAAECAVWIAQRVTRMSTLASGMAESAVRTKLKDMMDLLFSSYDDEWDVEARLCEGAVFRVRDCTFKPDSLRDLLAAMGLEIGSGPCTARVLQITVDLNNIFTRPWEVKVEGVRLSVRPASNPGAGSSPRASAPCIDPCPAGGTGQSFWEEVLPLVQALEVLKLCAEDLQLEVQSPDFQGRALLLSGAKFDMCSTSGPPHWKVIGASDIKESMATYYKQLSLSGLSMVCIQPSGTEIGGNPVSPRMVFLQDGDVTAKLTKQRPGDVRKRSLADFLKAHYAILLDLCAKSCPSIQFQGEFHCEYESELGNWFFHLHGRPVKITLNHEWSCEELRELHYWHSLLSLAFASTQPDLQLQLNKARNTAAIQRAKFWQEQSRTRELEERCEGLEFQVAKLESKVDDLQSMQKQELQTKKAAIEDLDDLQRRLLSVVPRSNTPEMNAANDINAIIDNIRLALQDGLAIPKQEVRQEGWQQQPAAQSLPQLAISKQSWNRIQLGEKTPSPRTADYFSRSRLWMAIKFKGRPDLLKVETGCLEECEPTYAPVTWQTNGNDGGEQESIELIACWLDLKSQYKPEQQIDYRDFTIALHSVSVRLPEVRSGPGINVDPFSVVLDATARVWDAQNAIVIDARRKESAPLFHALPIHKFSDAGKTKIMKGQWDRYSYLYQNEVNSKAFNNDGIWVGPGNGKGSAIYRHYGSSDSIEMVLSTLPELPA